MNKLKVLKTEKEFKERGATVKAIQGLVLSNKDRAFLATYTETWNATEAARSVGYKNPKLAGHKLVTGQVRPNVQRAIEIIQERNQEVALMKSEDLQKFLATVISLDITDAFSKGWIIVEDPKDIPKALRMCMTKINVKTVMVENDSGGMVTRSQVDFAIADKLKAAELLMRSLGDFAPQKVDVTVGSIDWDGLVSKARERQSDEERIANEVDAVKVVKK